jgi:hypothetical protein
MRCSAGLAAIDVAGPDGGEEGVGVAVGGAACSDGNIPPPNKTTVANAVATDLCPNEPAPDEPAANDRIDRAWRLLTYIALRE